MQNNFSDMKQRSDRDRSDQLSLDFDSIPFFVEAYGQAVNSRTATFQKSLTSSNLDNSMSKGPSHPFSDFVCECLERLNH